MLVEFEYDAGYALLVGLVRVIGVGRQAVENVAARGLAARNREAKWLGLSGWILFSVGRREDAIRIE